MVIRYAMFIVLFLMLPAILLAEGGVTPATMEKYRQTKDKVEKLPNSKAGELSRDTVAAAARSIATAQDGLKAGDEKVTRDAVEMADLQVSLALAQTEEKEAAKATAAARNELAKAETRLTEILAGKGDMK